jgi:hypothetical protein
MLIEVPRAAVFLRRQPLSFCGAYTETRAVLRGLRFRLHPAGGFPHAA